MFFINAVIPVVSLFVLFIMGGLGAGDIKLLSVMATVVGVRWTYKTFAASVFLAGCVAIVICIKEQKISKRKLHYSYYIGAGFLLVWLAEELIK